MFSSALVLFREVLEMALILSVVAAATRGVPARGRWILAGLGGGLAGSLVVAAFAEAIANGMEGMGQEIFNAGVLIAATAMIIWTVVWMKQHGRELANRIKHVGHQVVSGERHMMSLAVLVSLAMWREGSEIVLFMYGIVSAGTESISAIVIGAVAGAASAAAIGLLLYLGLIRVHAKHMFSVTGVLLSLLAAGMAAQAAAFLSAAGVVPDIIPELWDTSAILSEDSVMGRILHGLIGYTARPSAMQLIWYAGTLLIIAALLSFSRRTRTVPADQKLPASPQSA